MDYRLRVFLLSGIDLLILAGTYCLSYLVVQGGVHKEVLFSLDSMFALFVYLLICHISLLNLKSYKTLWSYTGLREIRTVIFALFISNFIFSLFFILFVRDIISILLILPLSVFSISFLCGYRLLWMIKKQSFLTQDRNQKRTLIIGAGDAGARLVQQMRQSKDLEYNPIGFIEDNPQKQNMEILGVPVLGKRSDLDHVVNDYHITDIIIAMPSVAKSEMTEIVNLCKKSNVNIKIVPSVKNFIQGDISIKEIREINIKDLLGRDTIHPTKRLKEYLPNKTILITGAGGSIGSELANQVAKWEPECLILMGHGENSIFNAGMMIKDRFPSIRLELVITDIQDKHLIEQTFRKYKPQIVFHAAAHKHVPLMETSEGSAVRNNIFGTKNVAEASHRFQVERFVLISTDKAVHPINIMGMTKRIGEVIVQNLSKDSSTKFSIVRFGNVLESRGSVIPIFRKQIEAGGPVTVTHPEMVRYFMTIPEAVQLVLEAGALSRGGEVFVLDMGEPLKIAELAKKMIRLYGYEPDQEIQIKYTGIRPGEKLNESLFYEFEKIKSTAHPYVVIAVPTKASHINIQQDLIELEDTLLNHPEKLREILSTMIQKDISN